MSNTEERKDGQVRLPIEGSPKKLESDSIERDSNAHNNLKRQEIRKEIKISKEIAKYDTLRAFFWTMPISIGVAILANKTWPAFQKIRTPYKLCVTILPPVAYSAWTLDNNSILAGKRMAQIYKDKNKNLLEDSTVPNKVTDMNESSPLIQHISRHSGKILFGSWLGVIGTSLLLNWRRKDLSTGQKIINARVTAQIAALTSLGLMAYYLPNANKNSGNSVNSE